MQWRKFQFAMQRAQSLTKSPPLLRLGSIDRDSFTKGISMLRPLLVGAVLTGLATASPAGTFRYSSPGVNELDYFFQFIDSGLFVDVDSLSKKSNAILVYSVSERIRRNTTYVFDYSLADYVEEAEITTGPNRQVVDWRISLRVSGGSIDNFGLFSSPSGESTFGYTEYTDAECYDTLEDEQDESECFRSKSFNTSGIGSWEPVPPVPLPASLPLLAAGVLCLGAWRRRHV